MIRNIFLKDAKNPIIFLKDAKNPIIFLKLWGFLFKLKNVYVDFFNRRFLTFNKTSTNAFIAPIIYVIVSFQSKGSFSSTAASSATGSGINSPSLSINAGGIGCVTIGSNSL